MDKIGSAVMNLYYYYYYYYYYLHLNRHSSFYAQIVLLLFNLIALANIKHSLI